MKAQVTVYIGILVVMLAAASTLALATYAHTQNNNNSCTSEGCRGDFTLLPNQTAYQAGYQAGLDDYNQHVNDTSHSFECPIAKIAPHGDFCKGYDRALSYMFSDQAYTAGKTDALNSGIYDVGSSCGGHTGNDCTLFIKGYTQGYKDSCSKSKFIDACSGDAPGVIKH